MNLAKISKKLRIKWNFELTVFELTVPDLYYFFAFRYPQLFKLERIWAFNP